MLVTASSMKAGEKTVFCLDPLLTKKFSWGSVGIVPKESNSTASSTARGETLRLTVNSPKGKCQSPDLGRLRIQSQAAVRRLALSLMLFHSIFYGWILFLILFRSMAIDMSRNTVSPPFVPRNKSHGSIESTN